MKNETIDESNEASVKWDDACFRFCEFQNINKSGGIVSSTFDSCTFKNIEWYWGIFTHATFFQCRFSDCTFRGTSFTDARFIECDLTNCNFVKDNLNAECDFTGAVSYASNVENCSGYNPRVKG